MNSILRSNNLERSVKHGLTGKPFLNEMAYCDLGRPGPSCDTVYRGRSARVMPGMVRVDIARPYDMGQVKRN